MGQFGEVVFCEIFTMLTYNFCPLVTGGLHYMHNAQIVFWWVEEMPEGFFNPFGQSLATVGHESRGM